MTIPATNPATFAGTGIGPRIGPSWPDSYQAMDLRGRTGPSIGGRMTRKNTPPTTSLVRSSAAEYLTFVGGGVEAVYADDNVWPSQTMMAQLYDIDIRTVNHELVDSVARQYAAGLERTP